MFIDLHMHEKTCSKDSFLSLAEMVELAKKRGLEGSLDTLRGVCHIFPRKFYLGSGQFAFIEKGGFVL